jgi:hypothetical protein
MMTMPFGRYQGRPITAVPRRYLRWLRDNVPLQPQLAYVVNCFIYNLPLDPRTDEEKVEEIVQPWAG